MSDDLTKNRVQINPGFYEKPFDFARNCLLLEAGEKMAEAMRHCLITDPTNTIVLDALKAYQEAKK